MTVLVDSDILLEVSRGRIADYRSPMEGSELRKFGQDAVQTAGETACPTTA